MTTYSCQGVDYEVVESRFGLFTSIQPDGTRMTTAATKDACIYVTDNIHIPCLKGTFDGYTSTPRSATVQGKL